MGSPTTFFQRKVEELWLVLGDGMYRWSEGRTLVFNDAYIHAVNHGGLDSVTPQQETLSSLYLIVLFQAGKKEHIPKLLGPIFSVGVGVFFMKGWGPKSLVCPRAKNFGRPRAKKFGMSLKTQRNQTLGHDIPGLLPGYPRCDRKFWGKGFCQNFGPYFYQGPGGISNLSRICFPCLTKKKRSI